MVCGGAIDSGLDTKSVHVEPRSPVGISGLIPGHTGRLHAHGFFALSEPSKVEATTQQ